MYREAFDAVKKDLLAQFAVSSLADSDGHTRLVMAWQMVGALEKHLRKVIHDGAVAVDAINLRGKRLD